MHTRSVLFLGLSLAANGLGCGGSAILLESPGDGGPVADSASAVEAAVGSQEDSGSIPDGTTAFDASCSPGGTRCIGFDASPGVSDASPRASDGGAGEDGASGGDASACPTGISWASPGPGLGQPCPSEGEICEDTTCEHNCAEPCNSVQCYECDSLTCANGTWQSSFVTLPNCDAGAK